jgi:hypothetical protein
MGAEGSWGGRWPYRGPDTLTASRLAFRATVAAKALTLLRDDARLSTGAA